MSSSSTPLDHQRSQAGEKRSDVLKARLCLPEVTAEAAPAEVTVEPAQLPPTSQAASPTQGPGVRGLYSTRCTEHAFSPTPYLNLTPIYLKAIPETPHTLGKVHQLWKQLKDRSRVKRDSELPQVLSPMHPTSPFLGAVTCLGWEQYYQESVQHSPSYSTTTASA